jgi:hypothetical protein
LVIAKDRVLEAARTKSEFWANMSHEFVSGFVQPADLATRYAVQGWRLVCHLEHGLLAVFVAQTVPQEGRNRNLQFLKR